MKNKKILRMLQEMVDEARMTMSDKTVDENYARGRLNILVVTLERFTQEVNKEKQARE